MFGEIDEEHSKQSIYFVNIRQLRAVLDELEHNPDLRDAIPGLSHFCLFLEFSGKQCRIYIWGKSEGLFDVYHYCLKKSKTRKEWVATRAELASVLRQAIAELP